MCLQKIIGVANYPKVGKFRVMLQCGHSILYDHTVDPSEDYKPGNKLWCSVCDKQNENEDAQ